MAICKAEGIVLRSMVYRETSKIVTLFTKEFGKVKVIAKGARKPKSKFGASLEPLTRTQIVFYRKERGGLYTLSEGDVMDSYSNLRRSLLAFSWGSVVLEFLDRANPYESANPRLYLLSRTTLKELNQTKRKNSLSTLVSAFLTKALGLLGYLPHLERCLVCRKEPKGRVRFSVARGGVCCLSCASEEDLPIGRDTLKLLQSFERWILGSVTKLSISPKSRKELNEILDRFIAYYLENKLSSLDFVRQLQT